MGNKYRILTGTVGVIGVIGEGGEWISPEGGSGRIEKGLLHLNTSWLGFSFNFLEINDNVQNCPRSFFFEEYPR